MPTKQEYMQMHRRIAQKEYHRKAVILWCREHPKFVSELRHQAILIARGAIPGKFDAEYVRKAFFDNGFQQMAFSAEIFLAFWPGPRGE